MLSRMRAELRPISSSNCLRSAAERRARTSAMRSRICAFARFRFAGMMKKPHAAITLASRMPVKSAAAVVAAKVMMAPSPNAPAPVAAAAATALRAPSARSLASRRRMVEGVGGAAQKVVDTYDRRREASDLADGARNAVAAAAATGAGALGLGAIITFAATTAAADFTGILLASVIAACGFFIIPAKRKRAKAQMRERIADVRARLSAALRKQFEEEIGRSSARMRESIAPYSRFVRAEGEKLGEADARLARLRTDLARVRERVDAMA